MNQASLTRSTTERGARLSQRRRSNVRWALALALGFAFAGARDAAAAGSETWNGNAGDNKWETKGNWSSNQVPGKNDSVTINSGTVTINTDTANINSLTMTGGTLTLNGTSTLNMTQGGGNNFTLSGGSFNGASGNVSFGNDLVISGTASYQAPSGTSAIAGNLTMTGGTYTGAGSTTVSKNVDVNASTTSGGDPTLVGYWSFDDTGATNHGLDSSGNGNNLSWSSTAPSFPTTGLPSLAFDPTNPYAIAMTNQTSNAAARQYGQTGVLSGIPELRPSTVSLSAWYKASSTDTVASEIVSGSNTYALRIASTGLVVMKQVNNSTVGAQWIEYQVPFSGVLDGNWHQIVGVITTGTGGSMTAYLDGAVAAGNYAVGGTTTPLTSTTTPTATAAAQAALYWSTGSQNTESYGLSVGYNPSTNGYNFGANATAGSTSKKCGASDSSTTTICAIDDVRVYNRALTAADVAALYHGNQPASSEGVLSIGGTMNVSGSVTIEAMGTLTLSSGGTLGVGIASSKGLIMDGTLNATGGTITMSGSTRYPFVVGSTSTASPTLNINTLSVQNVDTNGVQINASGGASTGASTTFTQFDKVSFGAGASGTTALLNIFASSLYLVSNGCTFGSGSTYAVQMTSEAASSATGPRALFGNATCATNDATTGLCATSEKHDNDTCVSGVCSGVPSSTNGAIVQFIRAAESDTDGTLVGFPTAAFDWSSFSYYSTYVTFHNASGGNDTIYVRDESGNPLYAWTNSADKISGTDETIVGTPQWMTDSSTGKHYVYVAVNGAAANTGGVYRLLDTTGSSGSLALDTSWVVSGTGSGAGYYACQCTITSALTVDASNIYWGATSGSGTKMLYGIKQLDGSAIKAGWPVTGPSNVTTSAPTIVTSTGNLYLGSTSTLAQLTLSSLAWEQDNPTGIGTITGRVSYGTSILTATYGTTRIYVGDSGGSVWAVDPGAFSSSGTVTTNLWKYTAGSAVTDNYYDNGTDTVMFGTAGGKVVALTGAGSSGLGVPLTGYPYTLSTTITDSVSTAPLYYNGVLVVGTSKGNLYFLDRSTGSGVSVLLEVNFGLTESVSTIGFDPTASRFMVTTSSAANDGRLYYFDAITDPTTAK